MERIIVLQLSDHLKDNGLISKNQHGFLKARSTSTNLLESLNDWTLHFNTQTRTDVAFIDFSKAFDKVSRNKLMHKLKSYGITGNLLAIIQDFLTNRSQRTRVGSSLSDAVPEISGIVQGSCLGPLLFVLFANDLCDDLSESVVVKMYADDVKVYNVIETSDDVTTLQKNIDHVLSWAKTWQLEISMQKCFLLPIGGERIDLFVDAYRIGDHSLPQLDAIKDLGILVDRDLKFSDHVSQLVKRAHARCCLISRCFMSRDRQTLLKAYTTYVRPMMEYASCVWSPRLSKGY